MGAWDQPTSADWANAGANRANERVTALELRVAFLEEAMARATTNLENVVRALEILSARRP